MSWGLHVCGSRLPGCRGGEERTASLTHCGLTEAGLGWGFQDSGVQAGAGLEVGFAVGMRLTCLSRHWGQPHSLLLSSDLRSPEQEAPSVPRGAGC